MSTEQIVKFQPDRTLYLRGVDGAGAAAALFNTSPSGFSAAGVFRDMADFCVLVVYDADNIFEHYTVRTLPDPNLSGMVLNFDLSYQGLQPIDSAKYSWIDWATLDVIPWDGSAPEKVVLWDHATLVSGDFTSAQGTFTFTAPNNCTKYDRLTLVVNDTAFDFLASGGETPDYVANWFAGVINGFEWATFANSSVSVIASTAPNGQLILKYARAGYVDVSGTNVTWILPDPKVHSPGIKFTGLMAAQTIYIKGNPYVIEEVLSPISLTLTSSASNDSAVPYLAEFGGLDGNGLTVYMVVRTPNYLQVDKSVLTLTGGNSDNVVWNVTLDFTALGIDQIRQAWFTFAPQLKAAGVYNDTEWTASFTNWSTSDPNGIGTLQVANADSTRVGNAESGCTYSSGDWRVQAANNYWHGFARVTDTVGATVQVNYSNDQPHDLYLGTSLYKDRGSITVSVDGDAATILDCYLLVGSELVTRRLLRKGMTAGDHIVAITIAAKNSSSSGTNFIFDYIEAAVSTPNIADAAITYSNVSPALDYDTDATYKMSPQRLFWHIRKLGFQGHLNEYLGVFWWNQRLRAGGQFIPVVLTVGGTWQQGDNPQLTIGGVIKDGALTGFFTIQKVVTYWDTNETIANHFAYYLNSSAVAVWAEITGAGEITIHPRTPNWVNAISATANHSANGTFSVSPDSGVGGDAGFWQVDPSAANPLNFAIQKWHADLFSLVKAAGMLITTSFSMELVYPPPDDGKVENAWVARYGDVNNTLVETDTGFAHLVSSQCAFVPNMTAFQQKVFTAMAALQSAAGLTPWLQFGEFLWWFFSSFAANVYSLEETNVISIQVNIVDLSGNLVQIPHGMASGDRVVITGVSGCTSANGTWPITVIDPMTFSIPVAANGAWLPGTGHVRGGSMAYYDAATSSAAQTQLGRALSKFTCQDDDPTVNGGADTAFLAGRLKSHVDAITSSVLQQFPNAKFEVLYPNDVNNPVCLLGPSVPYAQGGRMNAAVNLPPAWLVQAGSGLDSFKVEALSWSATYQNMDRAQEAVVFAVTPPMSWGEQNVAYLVPWFNGTCPWPREFLLAASRGLNLVNFWAYDHLSLMSWPVPLPRSMEKTGFLG